MSGNLIHRNDRHNHKYHRIPCRAGCMCAYVIHTWNHSIDIILVALIMYNMIYLNKWIMLKVIHPISYAIQCNANIIVHYLIYHFHSWLFIITEGRQKESKVFSSWFPYNYSCFVPCFVLDFVRQSWYIFFVLYQIFIAGNQMIFNDVEVRIVCFLFVWRVVV